MITISHTPHSAELARNPQKRPKALINYKKVHMAYYDIILDIKPSHTHLCDSLVKFFEEMTKLFIKVKSEK